VLWLQTGTPIHRSTATERAASNECSRPIIRQKGATIFEKLWPGISGRHGEMRGGEMVAFLKDKNAVASGGEIVGADTGATTGTNDDHVSFERGHGPLGSHGQLDELELKASATSSMSGHGREADDLRKSRADGEPALSRQATERSVEPANGGEVGF
jgi:hypothetical protein